MRSCAVRSCATLTFMLDLPSQITPAEVHERARAGSDHDVDDAAEDDADAVALDCLLELAIHGAERVLQYRRPGRERFPRAHLETLRAFQLAFAPEHIGNRVRIAGKEIDGEVTRRDDSGQRGRALVDGSE